MAKYLHYTQCECITLFYFIELYKLVESEYENWLGNTIGWQCFIKIELCQ